MLRMIPLRTALIVNLTGANFYVVARADMWTMNRAIKCEGFLGCHGICNHQFEVLWDSN